MSLFNVAHIIVNRVQSESSNNPSLRDREDARDRDETRNNSGDERKDEQDESQTNQNDDNYSLQDLKCYQCEKKVHLSRNWPDRSEKKKDDSNFTTENSEVRLNQNSNSNASLNVNSNSNQNLN